MGAALRVFWDALRDLNRRGYGYIWSNLLFVVLSIPVVTAPGAFAALMYSGHIGHTKSYEGELEAFWEAFRGNWLRAIGWALGHMLFAVVHLTNVFLYDGPPSLMTTILRTFWTLISVIWIGTIFYTWPIYFTMQQRSLLGATRNAVIMVLQNPLFTMILLLGMFLLSIVSTIFIVSWVLLTWGMFSSIANAAVVNRLSPHHENIPVIDA